MGAAETRVPGLWTTDLLDNQSLDPRIVYPIIEPGRNEQAFASLEQVAGPADEHLGNSGRDREYVLSRKVTVGRYARARLQAIDLDLQIVPRGKRSIGEVVGLEARLAERVDDRKLRHLRR